MLTTHVYTRFNDLPEHFLTFLTDFEKNHFFLGHGWFENFSQNTVETATKIRIFTVENNANPVQARAVLFMRAPAGQNGSYSQNIFSGRNTLASLTAHQSISFAPIIDENDSQYDQVIDTLIRSIVEDDANWNLIDLNFLNKDSKVYKSITNALNQSDFQIRHYDYRPNLYEDVSDITFKDFIASRPSMVKKTYMRKARKLDKTGTMRFELIENQNDMEKEISDYKDVLSRSWKEPELFPNHDAGVIRAAAKSGALRLGFLYVEEKPVAVQIWIVSSGRATIYKLHYDLNFNKESVGAILMLRMFEHMIDVEHIKEVDFGIGDEAAKSFWLKHQRPLCGIVAFNTKSVAGATCLAKYSADLKIQALKTQLRPLKQLIKSPKK